MTVKQIDEIGEQEFWFNGAFVCLFVCPGGSGQELRQKIEQVNKTDPSLTAAQENSCLVTDSR